VGAQQDDTSSDILNRIPKDALEDASKPYLRRTTIQSKGRWSHVRWLEITPAIEVFQLSIQQGINEFGHVAAESAVNEVFELYKRGTFIAERPTNGEKIIPSRAFGKQKYDASGNATKYKTRLVAGGHMQDKSLIPENQRTSPTVKTESVMMVATIAAKEGRAIATIDFPNAFLQGDFIEKEKPIYMRINQFEAEVLRKLDRNFVNTTNRDGSCIVKLAKPLYGCVQSARLWYDKITTALKSIGFIANLHDLCVFNRKEEDATQTTICIHVDDLFITAATDERLDQLTKQLDNKFPGISVSRGKKHDYLGLEYDFEKLQGCVTVTMKGYIDKLLSECSKIEGTSKTPATKDLFTIDSNSPVLGDKEREQYHSYVAMILYAAKRVRGDLLTAISFLTKRVQKPTKQDMEKLHRCIRYIRRTREIGTVLEADESSLNLTQYIDSAHQVHMDKRSHSGGFITLGKGAISTKSTAQSLNTSSSTESELVAANDLVKDGLWARNFLLGQGFESQPLTLYQDNKSTIALLENGIASASRVKHIDAKYFFLADRVKAGDIRVVYKPTEEMVADVLTKPLQGKVFVDLRDALLNWRTQL
jgi:hypothetical protein